MAPDRFDDDERAYRRINPPLDYVAEQRWSRGRAHDPFLADVRARFWGNLMIAALIGAGVLIITAVVFR